MQHSKIISGIDIGTSKVTTIVGQYFETEDRFNVIAVSSIPSLGFRKGQIINLDQATNTITQSIESAERMAGFEIKFGCRLLLLLPILNHSILMVLLLLVIPMVKFIITILIELLKPPKPSLLPAGKEIIHIIPRQIYC